jgi:hypothetical protein
VKEVDMRQFRQLGRKGAVVGCSLIVALTLGTAQAWVTAGGSSGAGAANSERSRTIFMGFLQHHDAGYYSANGSFEVVGAGEAFRGRAAIGEALGLFYGGAFTETAPEVRSLVVDGSTVVLEFVFNGTNTGDFMGLPATDRRVTIPMLGIYEIDGDYIRSGRLYFDHATLMRQLGHGE